MNFVFLKKLFRKKEYLYHGTTFANLTMIQKEGLDPKRFKRGFISLTTCPNFASFWGKLEVVLIIEKDKLDPDKIKKGWMENEIEYHGFIPIASITVKKIYVEKSYQYLKLKEVIKLKNIE